PVGRPRGQPQEMAVQAPQPVGVTLYLSTPLPDQIEVQTAQGAFTIAPRDLRLGGSVSVLDGRARFELLPPAQVVADTEAEEDYPALAVERGGDIWAAWLAYENGAERLLCRRLSAGTGQWSEPETLSTQPGDLYRPAAA